MMNLNDTGNYVKRTGKDTLFLIKNTFALIGKNKQILMPTLKQIYLAFSLFVVILLSVVFYSVGIFRGINFLHYLGISAIVLSVLFLIFILPFLFVYYRAVQSWIIYNSLQNNHIKYSEGKKRAAKNKSDIFWIGLIGIFVKIVGQKLRSGKGFLGAILSVLAKGLEKSWELIDHFLLPASIIKDETSVWQAAKDLKNLKNNVPGALAGVFGIDIVGGIFSAFVFAVPIILLIVGFLIMFFTGNIIFLVFSILVFISVCLIYSIAIGTIKSIYFTILYTMVSIPDTVDLKYRQEMTNYLNFKKTSCSFSEE